MKSRFSKALLIALVAGSTACVTTPQRPHGKPSADRPIEKEGQKIPGGEYTANPNTAPATPPTGPAAADAPGLWARTNNMQVPMNEDDLMRATQLYPTQPGSLEEAIFVVTQMRMLQKDWERRTSFQTQDLHTNQTADNTGGLSLEKTFQDLEMDLPKTLRSNSALLNHESLLLTKQLLSHTKNSDAFRADVTAALKDRGREWPDVIADEAPAAAAPNAPAPSAPGDTPSSQAGETAAAVVPAPAAADANSALD
ncbi:MAG: hypothetical protein EOP84_24010, partial [Verrucomicrobiaceae bacterium]